MILKDLGIMEGEVKTEVKKEDVQADPNGGGDNNSESSPVTSGQPPENANSDLKALAEALGEKKAQEAANKDDDSDVDDDEIVEESPCGRWLKRREEVNMLF